MFHHQQLLLTFAMFQTTHLSYNTSTTELEKRESIFRVRGPYYLHILLSYTEEIKWCVLFIYLIIIYKRSKLVRIIYISYYYIQKK